MYDFKNRLEEFFSSAKNSTRRESILINKMSYDLQLAAAINGYYLKVYMSDVDDNGYDIIIDSEMVTKKLQVKSLLTTSKTSSWKISKGLIKPDIDEQPYLVAWNNLHPPGIGGGILLQEVKLHERDISIIYYYTDIWIITLFFYGIIGKTRHQKLAQKFLMALHHGHFHDKQSISKTLFLRMKSPDHLLPIMGINSSYQNTNIQYLLKNRYNGVLAPKENIDISIRNEIDRLCMSAG